MKVDTILNLSDYEDPYNENTVYQKDVEYGRWEEFQEMIIAFENAFYDLFPENKLSWKIEKRSDDTYCFTAGITQK